MKIGQKRSERNAATGSSASGARRRGQRPAAGFMWIAKPVLRVWVFGALALLLGCSVAPGGGPAPRIAARREATGGHDRTRRQLAVAVPGRLSPVGADVRVAEAAGLERRTEPEPQPQPDRTRHVLAERREEAVPRPVAAERLRLRAGDRRLWAVPPPTRRARPSTVELGDRLQADLRAHNDSVAAAAARWAKQFDWTIGEEGSRWALSPGKLHLGRGSLPLPLNFEAEPFVQRELDRLADSDAKRRQSGRSAVHVTIKDRVRAHVSYAPPDAPPSTG